MLVPVLLSMVTLVIGKPPPYVNPESMYDNLPYLINRIQPPVEEVTHYDTLFTQKNWPGSHIKFGQVSGVDTDKAGDVHVFHRADRPWTAQSFGYGDVYQQRDLGPIKNDTLVVLDKTTGEVKRHFGKDKFYMPHGLTIDHEENLWVTDVALHQVFKYPKEAASPTLVLGKEFEPGHDDSHFCKPTDVAVASNGVFFVADGYCNSRVMKFSPEGKLLGQFGKRPTSPEDPKEDELYIPHSVTLIESQDLLCVADREHGRIQCFRAGLKNSDDTGIFHVSIDDPEMAKVFAVEYDPNQNLMYAVNGPNRNVQAVQGFTIDVATWTVVDSWGPREGFSTPHDVAVSPNGQHVYVAEVGPDRLWKLDRVHL